MATAPSLFNGSDLLIFIGTTAIAMSKSCSLSIEANMVDTTTKDSVGGWAESIPVGRNWTASVEGLVVWNENIKQFTDAIINKTMLDIKLAQRLSTGDDLEYKGSAFIASVEITAEQDAAVTYSISLTGCGALTD